ncbi:(2Fe-2S)-binding protein [Streptomyces sp. O3]
MAPENSTSPAHELTELPGRRSVLVAGAGVAGAAALAAPGRAAAAQSRAAAEAAEAAGTGSTGAAEAAGAAPRTATVALVVNGRAQKIEVDVRASLLDTLRERIGLTGPKKGCDQGACGACTVLVDGRRTVSCLTLAVMYEGRAVTTVEGLAQGGEPHPMQRAFIEQDGFQCGFCTSGQIVSAVGLLAESPDVPAEQVPELMSGNLCRCAAYPHITDAIAQARQATTRTAQRTRKPLKPRKKGA